MRSVGDLCRAGLPISTKPCPWCGATEDDPCYGAQILATKHIAENSRVWMAGDEPPHKPTRSPLQG